MMSVWSNLLTLLERSEDLSYTYVFHLWPVVCVCTLPVLLCV